MHGGTLRIRNWAKWQTYRSDRGQPPWIKVHRILRTDPDYISLTPAQRGMLLDMWMLAADRGGVIPASPVLLRRMCHWDNDPDMEVFIRHGFIEAPSGWRQDDVTVTPERRQDDDRAASQSRREQSRREDSGVVNARAPARADDTTQHDNTTGWEALTDRERNTITGLYGWPTDGTEGTQARVWGTGDKIVPEEAREDILRSAVLEMHAQEPRYKGNFFAAILKRLIAAHHDSESRRAISDLPDDFETWGWKNA